MTIGKEGEPPFDKDFLSAHVLKLAHLGFNKIAIDPSLPTIDTLNAAKLAAEALLRKEWLEESDKGLSTEEVGAMSMFLRSNGSSVIDNPNAISELDLFLQQQANFARQRELLPKIGEQKTALTSDPGVAMIPLMPLAEIKRVREQGRDYRDLHLQLLEQAAWNPQVAVNTAAGLTLPQGLALKQLFFQKRPRYAWV